MSARLIVVLEIDGVDPLTTDPHEIVGDILYEYEEFLRSNGSDAGPSVAPVQAEWQP